MYCVAAKNAKGLKLKEAVSVISKDSPCKDGNARFTMVLLKS